MGKEEVKTNKKEKSSKNNILLTVILIIAVGVGGFFAGKKYQQNKQPSRGDFQALRAGRDGQGFPGGPQSGTAVVTVVRGEIISINEDSVTVKLMDESSKIVLLSDNTEINKATTGTWDDLDTGSQIMVMGKSNSDGSVSASQIQLNFDFMGRGQPPVQE